MKLVIFLALMSVSAAAFAGGRSAILDGLGGSSYPAAPSNIGIEKVPVNWAAAGANGSGGGNCQAQFVDIAKKESEAQKIDLALILAIIEQESKFNPKAKSEKGALGLMQVMPATAKEMGLTDPQQLLTPETGIKYGVQYLKKLAGMNNLKESMIMQKETDVDYNPNVIRVIAGYNAGPGAAAKGVPQNGETPKYVEKVKENFKKYKKMGC